MIGQIGVIGHIGVSVRLLVAAGQEHAEGHALAAEDVLDTPRKEMTVVCNSVLTPIFQDSFS